MHGAFKALAAGVALVAPIGLGWAYTAGASVGDGGSALGSIFEDETVDEFAVDDFLITRESQNGTVSMSVRGPDGVEVDVAELPPDIADRVEYYESEWTPALAAPVFDSEGGVTCYLVPDELSPGSNIQVVEDDNDTTRLFEASSDDDGDVDVRAVEFDNSELTDDDRRALHDRSGRGLDTVTGGTELAPCES